MNNFLEKKSASIDIGSNSVRLRIKTPKTGKLQEWLKITALGKNMGTQKALQSDAMLRTEKVLIAFSQRLKKENIKNPLVFGTQAIRLAKNKKNFLKRIQKTSGLKIRILSGQEEAIAGFLGATHAWKGRKEITTIDIGGGSTEISIGTAGKPPFLHHSFPIGAVMLFEQACNRKGTFHKEKAMIYAKNIFSPLQKSNWKVKSSLIGMAGTITSFYTLKKKMKKYDRKKVHGAKLPVSKIRKWNKKLQGLTKSAREKLPGLEPKRTDSILGGGIILEVVMDLLQKRILYVSHDDILLGAFFLHDKKK